jgi:hypothetical protein
VSIDRYVQTVSDLPPQQTGASVPATRRVASGTPVIETPGGATAGVPVRDLPHVDQGLAIVWRAELRGALPRCKRRRRRSTRPLGTPGS